MIVLDASVAVKWFLRGEPQVDEAQAILDDVARDPRAYVVPELFMNEVMAVLCRAPGISVEQGKEALSLVESLGLTRVGNGHELMEKAAELAVGWGISGYDAVYVALASLSGGIWLTADARAVAKIRLPDLVRLLGA